MQRPTPLRHSRRGVVYQFAIDPKVGAEFLPTTNFRAVLARELCVVSLSLSSAGRLLCRHRQLSKSVRRVADGDMTGQSPFVFDILKDISHSNMPPVCLRRLTYVLESLTRATNFPLH